MQVAIIDADLIGRKRHRFPNLACMKLSGYHKQQGDKVILKTDYKDFDNYDKVYVSKVFIDTKIPDDILHKENASYGGTGFDYNKIETLPYNVEHTMPDYHLYDDWINTQIQSGKKRKEFVYYTDYSIGFLTRGCFRKCDFCVNKLSERVVAHSPLIEFLDPERPKICLLDDNFFGFPGWKELLEQLRRAKKPFQFKQGLDERLLTKGKCELLFSSRYDGDYIFAFDDIKDANLIEEKIILARQYTNLPLKFYCFCGFDRDNRWNHDFWVQDIFDLLSRIKILMQYKCIPYVMRFARYEESPYRGLYITIARWCNQPSFFKKKSLRQFAECNGIQSACYKYLYSFEKEFPEVSRFYDMKYESKYLI